MPTKLSALILVLALTFGVANVARNASSAATASYPKPGSDASIQALQQVFTSTIRPFFNRYCFDCHGSRKPAASLNFRKELSMTAIARDPQRWERVIQRLHDREMPPDDAANQPRAAERAAVIAWIRAMQDDEAERHAGDPGTVLAHRLSNAEFDYTIRDLTGVDIRPTREFPVDPANQAGFDNTGESLLMSPALLKRYLAAARFVADHLVLKPNGFTFAPHPVVTDTDRDKYCVKRIIDFYDRHKVDYADYFRAAYRYRYRAQRGRSSETLDSIAAETGLSAKYLATVWTALNDNSEIIGPMAVIRKMWSDVPPPNNPLSPLAPRPSFRRRSRSASGTYFYYVTLWLNCANSSSRKSSA